MKSLILIKLYSKILLVDILLVICLSSRAQSVISLLERQNIRSHALDNIKEFENTLNEIALSNNPEEKKVIISKCKETVFDKSANIEDDLNPYNSISKSFDFIPLDIYLERFPLVFKADNSSKAVTFTNIYASDVHSDEYTYINVYFECIFNGTHKVTKAAYKKVQRIATIKVFENDGIAVTKIVTVKYSNSLEHTKIKREAEDFEKRISENELRIPKTPEDPIPYLPTTPIVRSSAINPTIWSPTPTPKKPTNFYFSGGLASPLITKLDNKELDYSYEFMLGLVKVIGVYAKFTSNFSEVKADYTIANLPNNYYYESTAERSFSRMGTVGGLMVKAKPIVFYAGAGWGYYNSLTKADLYNYSDDEFVKSINIGNKNSIEGIETNAGIILKLRGIGLSAGVSSIEFKYYEINLGIGLFF